jgi:hypothetical protein
MDPTYNLLEYWKLYNRESIAPDSFIEMSLYYMVSAALQRKVWLQSADRAIFPNQYLVLCAPPGVGKGLVIRPASVILRHHKLDPIANFQESAMKSSMDKDHVMELINTAKELQLKEQIKQGDEWEAPLLIPLSAQATTFESLVNTHSKAVSRINPSQPDPKLCKNGVYTHSSLAILLDEMSTLFRKQSDDLVQYLIAGYDCQDIFEYKTKTQGKDRVRKGCINLLAGTTPEFLQNSSVEKLFGDGFFSRIVIIYEQKSKAERFDFPDTTTEQELAFQRIIDHVYRIAQLFGQVKYDPEAYDYMKHYTEVVMPGKPVNPDPKLEYYYSRKKLHLQKAILARHFSHSLDMTIRLEDCVYCTDMFDKRLEPKMHLALNKAGRNPLASIGDKIIKYLRVGGPANYINIWMKFESDVREAELIEILKGLEERGQIKKTPIDNQVFFKAVETTQ